MLKCWGKIKPKGKRSVVHFSPKGELDTSYLKASRVVETHYWEVWDGNTFKEAWNTVEIYSDGKLSTELTRRVGRRSL